MRVPPTAFVLSIALALLAAAPLPASETPAGEPQEDGAPEVAQAADDSVVPARAVAKSQKPPVYPPAALAARIHGTVSVLVTVGVDGKVTDVTVIACDHPNVGFEDASVKSVSAWEFTPATKDGQPVEYQTTYSFSFRSGGSGGNGRVFVTAGSQGTDSNEVRQAGLADVPPPSSPVIPKR